VFPGVGSVVRAIAGFVAGILKAVAGIWINNDFDFPALLFQGLLEFPDVVDRDAPILSTEDPQYWSVNLLQGIRVGGEVALVDDNRGQCGLLQRHVQRVLAAHAPSDRADPIRSARRSPALKRRAIIGCPHGTLLDSTVPTPCTRHPCWGWGDMARSP